MFVASFGGIQFMLPYKRCCEWDSYPWPNVNLPRLALAPRYQITKRSKGKRARTNHTITVEVLPIFWRKRWNREFRNLEEILGTGQLSFQSILVVSSLKSIGMRETHRTKGVNLHILLMEEIINKLIGSWSQYLRVFYIPVGWPDFFHQQNHWTIHSFAALLGTLIIQWGILSIHIPLRNPSTLLLPKVFFKQLTPFFRKK